ncbi:MAG TPA: outer membrane lipoprotein-sorting protein [Planctomycetota bacterium]|nr:outer membrane lipoprotein-sorting protein [Planctomycetota bacterium]
MRSLLRSAVMLAGVVLSRGAAQEDKGAAGDKVLAAVDEALNRAETLTQEFEVVNQHPGKAEETFALTLLTKGDKRLLEFTAPAKVAGSRLLTLSPTEIYSHFGLMGSTRRITGHARVGYLTMAFWVEDFCVSRYSADYQAAVSSETPELVTLVLTAKEGKKTLFPKLEMSVLKAKSVPTRLAFYDDQGEKVRTLTFGDYTSEGGVLVPTEIKMVDHTKEDCWTRLLRKSVKVNEPIPDDVFTKEKLKK